MIERLTDHPDYRPADPFAGPDHPVRRLTRAAALERRWGSDDARAMNEFFDQAASDWSADHVDDTKAAPLRDALDRGAAHTDERWAAGRWIELGSGTGAGAITLADHPADVDIDLVCVDLSAEMLAHAPPIAPRVRADSSNNPFPDDAADVVLCINMILFPDEVDRILRREGHLLWINTLGDQTPIHLTPDDVAAALPGAWTGTTARAGTGDWTLLRRA